MSGMLGHFAAPAAAATLDGMLDFGGYHLGAFLSSDGERVYCLDPGAEAPFSAQRVPTRVTELPGYSVEVHDAWGWHGTVTTAPVSGERLRQMNWVLSEHGDTADPELAASAQIALWELRRGPGNAAWLDAKYELFARHGGQRIVDAGVRLAAEARTAALGPGHATPDGELELALGEPHGEGTVSYPAGTVSLTIIGGSFADGSTTARITGEGPGVLAWRATLHEPEWARLAEVRVSGRWEVPERYWPAELVVRPASRESEQRTGSGVEPVTATRTGEFVADAQLDSRFEPSIETAVPELLVPRGTGSFADTVTVGAAQGSAPWPRRGSDGEHLPLIAEGVLYGPFASPQPEGDEPPAGAPVEARSTLRIDRGPGSYDVNVAERVRESGYYYWVWGIRESQQSDGVRASGLLADGGEYRDRFGARSEGQTVPTELRWDTKLAEQRISRDTRELNDRIRAELHGGAWLRDENGRRIPARVRLTLYGVDARPERLAEPPANARELGSVVVELSEPDVWVEAPPLAVPRDTRGWLVVRTCLVEDDQDAEVRGRIAEWCDDFGVPEETAEITEVAAKRPAAPTPTPTPKLAVSGTPDPGRLGALVPVSLGGVAVAALGALLCTAGSRRRAAAGRSARETS